MVRALEHMAWEGRLRVQGWRKESFGGDLIVTSNTCKEDMKMMKAGSTQWCMRGGQQTLGIS